MNVTKLMETATLRHMVVAQELWREQWPGENFQDALTDKDFRAFAALAAAALRINGDELATIDTVLDMPLESDDDAGEVFGGNGGGPPQLSPVPGT